MWRDRLDREDGVALIYVLFATMIVSGLVVVFMSRILFENRSTADARDFEAAIHVAEAGAESLFGAINNEGEDLASKVVTSRPAGAGGGHHRYTVDTTQSDPQVQRDEEAWVIARAEEDWAAGGANIVTTDEGQAYAIRPANAANTEALDMVFGVGFIPSIDHADRTVRVVKMRIARRYFSPDHALLTGADLKFGGNAEILAPGCDPAAPDPLVCNANVHANGNVDVVGSSHQVQGDFTSSGSMSGSANTVGGSSAAGEETIPVPPLKARDFYNRQVTYNVDPETNTQAEWFDLCVEAGDGVVRAPGTTPCTGSQVWPVVGEASTKFRGWEYKAGTNTWEARKVESGIFYVYGADASVNGSAGTEQRAVTILVESVAGKESSSGSLELSGNPELGSALPVLFITDRDLKMKGTAGGGKEDCAPNPGPCDSQSYAGFIYVGEQVDISGTVELSGAMISKDEEDLHGLVKRNTAGINGTMLLDYDDQLKLDLSGRVTIEYWNEL